MAEAGIFQRYSLKRNRWVDIDPPEWVFPQVGGIITTPTLRCDGSLLATPGYDARSELYLTVATGADGAVAGKTL